MRGQVKEDAHKDYVIIRSTTDLKKANIQIKGINEGLHKMKFDHVRIHRFYAFKRISTNHGRPYQEMWNT